MSSTTDKVKGSVNQTVGQVTDNKELEAKGKMQKTKGQTKSKVEEMGDRVSDKQDAKDR